MSKIVPAAILLALVMSWPTSLKALDADDTWWVVCTKRVVAGKGPDGEAVYCTKCTDPKAISGSVMIPNYCRRFVSREDADRYAHNVCNCD